jgi:hypothetical protein
MKERRSLKGNAMSVESMDTSLPCVKNKNKNEEEKKYKEKSKEYKTSTKGVLTWVNNGTQVMKMRN